MLNRNIVSALLIIFLFMVINVDGDVNCNPRFPCVCKIYNYGTFCYQDELQIKNMFNKQDFYDFSEIKGFNFYMISAIPTAPILRRYRNLTMFYLTLGNFKEIKKYAFEGLRNLQTVFITGSDITDIAEKAFSMLYALRTIQLSSNRITNIHNNAFFLLLNLERLDLSNNKIETLKDETFSQLVKLKELDLRDNPLITLQQNLFRANKNNFLAENSSLRLTADNMSCDSNLLWIFEIFKHSKSTRNDLDKNECWLRWKRAGIFDITANEKLVESFEPVEFVGQQTVSTHQLSAPTCKLVCSNKKTDDSITIINPSINTYVTLNYCHTPEDEDDTPDFQYK